MEHDAPTLQVIDPQVEDQPERSSTKLINWLGESVLEGIPPLSPARDLAQEYLLDLSYEDNDARVSRLIQWECSKNFTSGFITGLGGIITLPVSVSSSMLASWAIQARMCGAIAEIYGHDTRESRVSMMITLSLVGVSNSVKDMLKQAGVSVGKELTLQVLNKLTGKIVTQLKHSAGTQLLGQAGRKGVVHMGKTVPIVGGFISGGFDAATCRVVGKRAQEWFKR